MTIVGDAWTSLRQETGHESGWHVRRLHPSSACGLFAAILQPSSVPALLIVVDSDAVGAVVEFPSSRGFQVFPESVEPGHRGRTRICLVLADTDYRDVFEVLADDVAGTVAVAPTDDESVRAFLARLHVWQSFMRKHGAKGLTEEAQTGLFGELSFFSECLVGNLPAFDAVEAWRGPIGGNQDFRSGGCCVEVKSSTMVPPVSMEVTSIAQLDESLVDILVLCHVSLAAEGAKGTTLPELADRLREGIGKEDRSALDSFNAKLIEAGYLDIHAELYSKRRYRLRNVKFFRVQEGFPRIAAADVPEGISACSYRVLLAACTPFEMEQSEVQELMTEGVEKIGT